MANVKSLADQLVELSVKEVNKLAEILKEEHGIEPAAAIAPAVVAGEAQGGESSAAEEKTSFNVVLKSPGGQKLSVVKIVKEITGLGLKEAKELVDSAPKPIKEGVSKEESETFKSKLEEAGAEVEIN